MASGSRTVVRAARLAAVAMREVRVTPHHSHAMRRVGRLLAAARSAADRLELLGELRRAVASRELTLHFQPQVDPCTGRIEGVEALLRWPHPRRGLLAPAAFLPTVVDTRLMSDLTSRVLEMAARQAAEWRAAGSPLCVAVNLAACDVLDRTLPGRVERCLAAHGLPPAGLTLEISENTVVVDPVRVRAVLGELRELGVRLSLDDFGTGHSSLAQVKRLPLDELKIDRAFVAAMANDRRDAALVRTTIALADNLGLASVAEGVADAEAWVALSELRCHRIQGFYVGRPMPADVLARWMRDDARLTGARPHSRAGRAVQPRDA